MMLMDLPTETTSPTVFVLACCSPLTGKWSLLSCVCLRRGEQQKTARFCRETLEMMDARGERLDVLDLAVPRPPFTPTFGLVAASCMVNVGKGKFTTRLLCLPTRVKSLFEGPHPEKTSAF